jgi:hypothetical protein
MMTAACLISIGVWGDRGATARLIRCTAVRTNWRNIKAIMRVGFCFLFACRNHSRSRNVYVVTLVSKLIKSFGRSILRRVCPGLVGDKAVAFETRSPRATPNSVEEAGLRSNRHCSLCFVERLVAMSSYAFLFCIQFLFMTCDDPRPIQPSSLPKLWRRKALVISSLSSAAILGAHIRG